MVSLEGLRDCAEGYYGVLYVIRLVHFYLVVSRA